MSYSWNIIGERIRKSRKEMHISQEQMAEKISSITGLSETRQLIAGWENGYPVKKLEQLTAMCDIFHCDMGYLLCECDTKRTISQPVANALGISEKAVDTLIALAKDHDPTLQIISALIEDSAKLSAEQSEIESGYSIFKQITYAAYMNLGVGCAAHETTFDDASSGKVANFQIAPNDIYRNTLHQIHNSIDAFIEEKRDKANLPYYK